MNVAKNKDQVYLQRAITSGLVPLGNFPYIASCWSDCYISSWQHGSSMRWSAFIPVFPGIPTPKVIWAQRQRHIPMWSYLMASFPIIHQTKRRKRHIIGQHPRTGILCPVSWLLTFGRGKMLYAHCLPREKRFGYLSIKCGRINFSYHPITTTSSGSVYSDRLLFPPALALKLHRMPGIPGVCGLVYCSRDICMSAITSNVVDKRDK